MFNTAYPNWPEAWIALTRIRLAALRDAQLASDYYITTIRPRLEQVPTDRDVDGRADPIPTATCGY